MSKKTAEAIVEAAAGETDAKAFSAAAETEKPAKAPTPKPDTLEALARRVAVLERILKRMGHQDEIDSGVDPDGAQ